MVTKDKVTEIFCVMDEFCNNFSSECEKNPLLVHNEQRYRNRKGRLCPSEIMTILVCYYFGSFANFKHYCLFFVKQHLAEYFLDAVSYNRFVELVPRVFFNMMLFMKLQAFGKCSGISFVDSTMIPYVIIYVATPKRVLKGWLLTAKEQWAGVTASNFS